MGKGLLQNLIKYAKIVMGGKDDEEYPIQQVSYNGKVKDVFIVFPYGVHANLTKDSIVSLFPVDGSEQNKFAIGGLPNERIKNLPAGEVVFYHPLTKSKIHFKNDGSVDFETDNQNGDVNIKTGSGNVNINCSQANINATDSINIDSPVMTINSNLSVNGTMTNNGKDVGDTHGHNQSPDSAGNAEAQINGVI